MNIKDLLKTIPTRQLLGWLNKVRKNQCVYYPFKNEINVTREQLKEELALREHVPSKREKKILLKEKIKKGRGK